jgi:hypothetical protein
MPKTTRYTFVISAKMAQQGFPGFIDMLRYDAATVIEGSASFVVLQTVGREPTRDRWASFWLHILAQVEGDYPDLTSLCAQAAPKLPL